MKKRIKINSNDFDIFKEKINKCVYSDKLFNNIKSILGDSEAFSKMNYANKIMVSSELKKLSLIIDYNETFLTNYEIYKIIKDLNLLEHSDMFEEKMSESLNKEIVRTNSATMNNQFKQA